MTKQGDEWGKSVRYNSGCSDIGRTVLRNWMTDSRFDDECIEVIEHYEELRGFHLGNVFKYVWRAGIEGEPLRDLQTAKFYVERFSMKMEPTAKEWFFVDRVTGPLTKEIRRLSRKC